MRDLEPFSKIRSQYSLMGITKVVDLINTFLAHCCMSLENLATKGLMVAEITTSWYNYWMDIINVFI